LEHYVTLFDSLFLPQGLALHASLKRHAGTFTLWVLCMDERTQQTLDVLKEPTLRTIALADVETRELLAIKPGRSRGEYCWTMTPFSPGAVFEREPTAQRVTYLDADMFLLKSPQPIFDEFERSGKAVLITDHAYDAEYDQSATSGQFCVQFMTFKREGSETVVQWWQERCVEWCFGRVEDGKFGDQKYLDDWPVRFGGEVHVLQQISALLAPWNARRFPYSGAIWWHFHGLRLLGGNKVLMHGPYAVPRVAHRMVYTPYMAELKRGLDMLEMPVVQTRVGYRFVSLCKGILGLGLRKLREVRDYAAIRQLPK
jgi:hypothetical protein